MKILPILKKELVDALRDRRAVTAALAFAFVGPAVLVFIINAAAAAGRTDDYAPFGLCGDGQAPSLLARMHAAGLTATTDSDPAVCLDIPADYAARVDRGEPVRLAITADMTSAGTTVAAMQREIAAHGRSLAMQRLMTRGVAADVVRPIEVETRNTNAVSRQAVMLGNALILYIVFAPFIVVFAMAGDTSAGERERHSIETLLSHPARSMDIVIGKFIALAGVNIVGTAACVALTLVLIAGSRVAELGLRVDTSASVGVSVVALLVPLCALVSALQLALGFYAKTAREAQQTSMLVSLVPMMFGMALMMRQGAEVGMWPLAWELRALTGPLLGSTSVGAPFPAVAAIEIALAAAVLFAAASRLRSEKVLG